MKGNGNLLLFFIIGLLGVALLAMAGAVTALGDTLFPAKTLAQGLAQDANINASFLIRLRVIHPIFSIIVGGYIFGLGWYLRRKTVTAANHRLSLILGGLITHPNARWPDQRLAACPHLDADRSSLAGGFSLDHIHPPLCFHFVGTSRLY